MARDFVSCDRGQLLLMPPSLVEWLPEDHLVWTVLGAVDQMDLRSFRGGVSAGCGRVALRMTRRCWSRCFCTRMRAGTGRRGGSSGRVWEDVAYKVIAGMRTPDHSTIAEFRRRHETEIAELFDDVLGLCREAGLVSVGVITIDGTKIKANASMDQNRSYREIVTQILREAEEIDRREDELYGDARGDELPEQLRTPGGSPGGVGGGEAADRGAQGSCDAARRRPPVRWWWIQSWCSVVAGVVVAGASGLGSRAASSRSSGRARRGRSRAIGRTGCSRRSVGLRRTTGSTWPPTRPMSTGGRRRATRTGRVLKGNSKPFVPPELPDGDDQPLRSGLRVMRTQGTPPRQAYNAQTAVNDRTRSSWPPRSRSTRRTSGTWSRCSTRTLRHLDRHGVTETPEGAAR